VEHEAVIIGAAETRYQRHPAAGTTALGLMAEAGAAALDAAGVGADRVDGLAVSSFTVAPDRAVDVAWRLGLHPRYLADEAAGGTAAVAMLRQAVRAVEAGDAECVLLLSGDVFPGDSFGGMTDRFNSATAEHLAPLEFGGPNALFALLTARHAERFGLGREAYGFVSVAQRRSAADNPGAAYRDPLTLAQYLAAPLVSDPLCIYDCVPVVAGAGAVVVARAGIGTAPPVRVRSFATSYNADDQDGDGLQTPLAQLAPRLWEEAGAGPGDVDLLGVYDDYTVMVLIQLADLGYVPDGDVGRFVAREVASGRLRFNTAGGQLSAGQAGAAGAMHGLVEVVRQLQGRAPGGQVADARLGLVTGYGMTTYRYGAAAGAAVLEAVR
jgi:acetyl-CoA acetyltransferase